MVINFVSLLTLKFGTAENILNYDLEALLPALPMRGDKTKQIISSTSLYYISSSVKKEGEYLFPLNSQGYHKGQMRRYGRNEVLDQHRVVFLCQPKEDGSPR